MRSTYVNTPIELLLAYHNDNKPFETYTQAQLLIGMCMDHRKHLHIPENFAYIIRSGGANLRYSEFKVSYAIGVGGVKCIALLAHNTCGMVHLHERRDAFINGLIEHAGWTKEHAESHFAAMAPLYEIENETEFVKKEAARLRVQYPKVVVAALHYDIADNHLHIID